jgi:putative transposase
MYKRKTKEETEEKLYITKVLKIPKTEELDSLLHYSGEVYSDTLVKFWRIVRKKNIWLSCGSMEKLVQSSFLHAHSTDASIQLFYSSLKSWRERRKNDPTSNPPNNRKYYQTLTYKNSAIKIKDDNLCLANGRGNNPLIIPNWKFGLPTNIRICWNGKEYEIHAVYLAFATDTPKGEKVASVDIGEIHSAAVYDGDSIQLYNGREIRSKRRYKAKMNSEMKSKADKKQKGSNRQKGVNKSKRKKNKKINNQIKDMLHKQISELVSTLYEAGVQTVAVGDLNGIRKSMKYGKKENQKLHAWAFGQITSMIIYKCKLLGMKVELINEAYTSQTCPICGKRNSPKGRNYKCSKCKYKYHRDGVGAINIRQKYLESINCEIPVVGVMASPVGHRCATRRAS